MGSGPPRLTYPVSGQVLDQADLPSHSATEDAETELLPFALDSDAMPASPQPLAPLRARTGSGLSPAGVVPLDVDVMHACWREYCCITCLGGLLQDHQCSGLRVAWLSVQT